MARKKKEEIESTVVEGEVMEVVQEAPTEDIQMQMQNRVMNCNQELSAVLAKYRCNLDPSVLISGNGKVTVNIRIIPVP